MATVIKFKKAGFGELAAAKLESSGLTVEQALDLGMYDVGNAATLERYFEPVPALVIPYYDIDGRPLKGHKSWPEFYRIRYLGEDHSFGAATEEKPKRYVQPANVGNACAYFPQGTNWKAIAADPAESVLITEGELKAAKACAEGFPTIGLGGVWNFRAAKDGIFFLPELEQFDWTRRKVTIVYDSDYKDKPNICASMNAIAEELSERGALVYAASIPDVYEDDRKTGLDDLLKESGDEPLLTALATAAPLGFTRQLWRMNEELVYIKDPGLIVYQNSDQRQEPSKFAGHGDYMTLSVPENKVRADGTVSIQKVAAAPVWLKWPMRRTAEKLSFLPGEERFCEYKGSQVYNQWKGWGVEPKKGDVTPFIDLFNFIFDGATKEEKDWALDWFAYPIQFPGTKIFSAMIIHGRLQGTGKTLLGYTLGDIYGENFQEITSKDLLDSWWAEKKQFVLGDEVSGTDKRAEADAMKSLITQEHRTVNVKYVPQFTIPDCTNFYLTSNHADALFLEDNDRRFYIQEVRAEVPLPEAFYQKYDKWRHGDGPAHLMHWLQQRDVSKFNPKGPAFKTAARERMVNSGKSDLDMWCADLRSHPEGKLAVGQMRHQRDMFTSLELLNIYEAENERAIGKLTASGMGRALAKAGFEQVFSGQPIKTLEGKQGRYYIVRNKEKWLKIRNGKELAKHIALGPVR